MHSFTPVWKGRPRATDIGILHVSRRATETAAARRWQHALRRALPEFAVHRNRPYRGDSDGYVPWLVGQFPEGAYCGLELEVNQRRLAAPAAGAAIEAAAAATLGALLHDSLRDDY